MSIVHSFDQSLVKSHELEDNPIWREVYEKAYPTMVAMVNHRQDGDHQRLGVDRSITLANSKQILIDEKARYKNANGTVYEDILLEVWSDKERKTEGWVQKSLIADYIAYAILPLGICYMLPVVQLQNAWRAHSAEWIDRFGLREAVNTSWITVSCPVDKGTLFKGIGEGFRLHFDPLENK